MNRRTQKQNRPSAPPGHQSRVRNPKPSIEGALSGVIRVLGMRFAARHGVHPEEKALKRPFEVDVEVTGDFTRPAKTDDLTDTLDYGRIAAAVREVMEGEPTDLLERLAGAIIERLRPLAPSGGTITVRVRKPCAPLDVAFETVEVELRLTPEPSTRNRGPRHRGVD